MLLNVILFKKDDLNKEAADATRASSNKKASHLESTRMAAVHVDSPTGETELCVASRDVLCSSRLCDGRRIESIR